MEKIKMNITENREMEKKAQNFKNIDNRYTFYYDETNNIRKFWFKKENMLNIPIEDLSKNFVLGGVCHYSDEKNFDISSLKDKLKLQKNVKEIKLKNIAKGDFIECIKSEKLESFLDWLIESNLYIHHSSINILYWSLIDILESIIPSEYLSIHHELKTVLYELIKLDFDAFVKILYKYEYPNIKRESSKDFLDDLIRLVENNKLNFTKKYPFINQDIVNIIVHLLNNADSQDLTFIMDEEDHMLIENLFHFYLRPLGIFKNSLHIFDEEEKIEEDFSNYDLYDGNQKWEDIKFEDSENNELIQISDVIIGLLGKLYDSINKLDIKDIDNYKDNLNELQKKNLSTIAKLILKSDNQSLALSHSTVSLLDKDKFSSILKQFL